MPGASRPWATVVVTALALVAILSRPLSDALIYRRSLIFAGEIWRLWSGHAVHFGWSHLLWDLAVFVPTCLWLERLHPRAARWLCVLAPVLISGSLLAFDSALERYAGLSGLAAGTLAALACFQLHRRTEPRWLWWAMLALLAGKVVFEQFRETPLLVSGFETVRNVPLAHLIGGLAGAACALLIKPRPSLR